MDNLEQLEAKQANINQQTKEFYDTLSEEDKLKLDSVDAALGILTKAGVPATIVAEVPSYGIKQTGALTYHNWNEIYNSEKSIDFNITMARKIHNSWVRYGRSVVMYLAYMNQNSKLENPIHKGLQYLEELATSHCHGEKEDTDKP